MSSFCPAIGVSPIRAYAWLVLMPYRLASWDAVAWAADSASVSGFWPLPKSMVMMFTTLTFTPYVWALCSTPSSADGSPLGATASV